MTTKLCTACQEEPRMRLQDGTFGKMCAGCQKDADDNARAVLPTRFCQKCQTNKRSDQFMPSSRTCIDCRRAADNERKAASRRANPDLSVAAGSVRVCKRCGEQKALEDFPKNGHYYKTSCKACYAKYVSEGGVNPIRGSRPLAPSYPERTGQPQAPRQNVLLVDRDRGQVILCEVMSEIPSDVRQLDHILLIYAQRGYRVVDAVEREGVI